MTNFIQFLSTISNQTVLPDFGAFSRQFDIKLYHVNFARFFNQRQLGVKFISKFCGICRQFAVTVNFVIFC